MYIIHIYYIKENSKLYFKKLNYIEIDEKTFLDNYYFFL